MYLKLFKTMIWYTNNINVVFTAVACMNSKRNDTE